MALPRDVQEFLDFYPDQDDDASRVNLEFYSNARKCQPDNLLIEDILDKWSGQYSILERRHGFIQWLFPIRESGMNYQSEPLSASELELMKKEVAIKERLIRSYRLMLDFYGMKLVDESTGQLQRGQEWESQFHNLTTSSHNYLRISRILKCLAEFDLGKYHAGFILFVLAQQSENDLLNGSYLKSSMARWWTNCNRDPQERLALSRFVQLVHSDQRQFSTKEYEQVIQARGEGASLQDLLFKSHKEAQL